MDRHEQETWRRWKADPTPENAMQWAVVRNRSLRREPGNTLASELDMSPYEDHEGSNPVEDVLERAAEVYLSTPWSEVMIQDFHWITESHLWLLECRPSPRVIRLLAKFYEKNGLELKVGDEDQAYHDYQLAMERNRSGSRYRREAERLRLDVGKLERELKKAHRKVASLKFDPESTEHKRTRTELAQLQASYDALKEENERLAGIVQRRAKGGE